MDILQKEDREGIAILTLNRPDALNALSGSLARALETAIDDCIKGGTTRCIVLTGAGRGFCAGADLSEKLAVPEGSSVLESWYHPLVMRMRTCPIPIVVAVNGVAAGAGLSLALLADIVTCSDGAYFLQAFVRAGLVPDCGSSWLLTRRIGDARAREMTMLAERLPAQKALAWGLVNRVYPADQLIPETLAIAATLANGPASALSRVRGLFETSATLTFEAQIAEEDRCQRLCAAGAEAREGRNAFREKRTPDYQSIPRSPDRGDH